MFTEDPDDLALLGKIVKAKKRGLSVLEIKEIIEEIFNEESRYQIRPPQNDENPQDLIEEQEMEAILRKAQPLLEQVFYLLSQVDKENLQDRKIKSLIEERFQAWEKIVSCWRRGERVDISKIKDLKSEEIKKWALAETNEVRRRKEILRQQRGLVLDHLVFPDSQRYLEIGAMVDGYIDKPLEFGGTGCGIGSGFGDDLYLEPASPSLEKTWERLIENPLNLAMTYQGAENLRTTKKERFYCPFCGKETDPCKAKCQHCHTKNPNQK